MGNNDHIKPHFIVSLNDWNVLSKHLTKFSSMHPIDYHACINEQIKCLSKPLH